jgi:hypothetical protein
VRSVDWYCLSYVRHTVQLPSYTHGNYPPILLQLEHDDPRLISFDVLEWFARGKGTV